MSRAEKQICDLGEIVTGKTPSTSNPDFFGGDYPFVTPSDIEYGHYYVRKTETTVTELAKNKHKNQFVPKDSVLFTCIGNTMGKCAIAARECLTNQQINAVVANDDNDPKFLYYLLHHSRNVVRGIGMGGGAATPIINKTTFGNIKLRLPTDKTTQEAISSILSQYDDLIENNKRRIELLEETARQLYKEWFVRFRFPGHEHVKIIDGVPEGWDQGAISDFFDTTSGGTPSRNNPDFFTGDINWVKTQELNEGFILSTEEKITDEALSKSSAKLFPENTLLVSMYGGTNIGRTGILASPAACNQACCALFPKDDRAHFIFASLYFYHKRSELMAMSQGAAQTNVNQQTIRGLKIVFPPTSLMGIFIGTLTPIYEQIKTLQKEIKNLIDARDLLLPKLMSGEIAV